MMSRILLLLASLALLFSCHTGQVNNQPVVSPPADTAKANKPEVPKTPEKQAVSPAPDTASTDYLVSLLKNEQPLNDYWKQKLKVLDVFELPQDSMAHWSFIRDWVINDSVSVIIISHSTGTDYDEFVLTLKNKKEFISNAHISDNADSDLSPDNPYYYTKYEVLSDRKIKCFNHKVTGTEGEEEKDRLISTDNWLIQDNGKIIKR